MYPALRLRVFAVLVAVAGPLATPAAANESGRLFLWKATSKTNTVYLLGSIHVANQGFYPLADEIGAAFAESKALAVEVDLTKVDQEGLRGAMLQKGMYPGNDSIADHVPKATLQKLRNYFEGKGMIPDAMEKFRPWALAVTITMLEVQAQGYESSLGVDKHFMEKAGGKKVIELESADDQINLLSSFPEKLEAEFLAATLDSVDKTRDLMAKTVALWKAGDVAGMEKLLVTDPLKERPDLKGVYAKLFDERNEKMAKKVEAFLKEKDTYFVVVGAGHLIGKKGIVSLLEKKGYKLEQMRGGVKEPAVADAGKGAGEPGQPAQAAQPAVPADGKQKPVKRGYAPADAFAD